MKHKLGTFLMVLGTTLVLAAMALLVYNQYTAFSAEKASTKLLAELVAQVDQRTSEQNALVIPANANVLDPTMDTVYIDGNDYIGYLTIPSLTLELPIMSDWSYPQLRTAPCRFSGTVGSNDLVLMAHNYARHFGSIANLTPGDKIYFRDVQGITTEYDVVVVDVLSPTAVEEMTSGEFDLTLFTCTYGGKSRVTVRCDRSQAENK